MKYALLFGVLISFSWCNHSVAENHYTVQLGAFSSRDKALEFLNNPLPKNVPVTILSETSKSGQDLYKVVCGNFISRQEAENFKNDLKKSTKFTGMVRLNSVLNKSVIDDLLMQMGNLGDSTSSLNLMNLADDETTISKFDAGTKLLRSQLVNSSNLSINDKISSVVSYLSKLPNDDILQSVDTITFAYQITKNLSAYDKKDVEIQPLIMQLEKIIDPENRVLVRKSEYLKARDLLAHLTHYYSRNYAKSLKIYKDNFVLNRGSGDRVNMSRIRMEVAACLYELVKSTGYDKTLLLEVISKHWQSALNEQEACADLNKRDRERIAVYNCRLGLMFTEILIDIENFNEAQLISQAIIDYYQYYEGCNGYLAESYCHLATIGLKKLDEKLCLDSVDNVIKIREKYKSVWGDVDRDPLWKAYTIKNAAGYYFNKSDSFRAQVKDDMIEKFSDHPSITKYIPELNLKKDK